MIKCEEVLKTLYEYIDKQLDESSQAKIEEHIKLCRHCRCCYDFEIELRKFVSRSCFQNKAPKLLKTKILELLNEDQPEQ